MRCAGRRSIGIDGASWALLGGQDERAQVGNGDILNVDDVLVLQRTITIRQERCIWIFFGECSRSSQPIKNPWMWLLPSQLPFILSLHRLVIIVKCINGNNQKCSELIWCSMSYMV